MTQTQKTALVTNATGYGGPGAVSGLLGAGVRVYAQDAAFADQSASETFVAGRDGVVCVSATDPDAVVSQALAETGRLDAMISNDHYPAPAHPPMTADPAQLQQNLNALVVAPFRMVQAVIAQMTRQGGGNIVMITSNRDRLPLSGGAFPDAARAAANAMLRSLAVDLAPKGITVNGIAPNFLYSEAYYPKHVFEHTQAGRDYITTSVPTGGLADPAELGEVVAFLALARTRHLTGAILEFAGGWPAAPARPEL